MRVAGDDYNARHHLSERALLDGLVDGLHDIRGHEGLFILITNVFHHVVELENRMAELERRLDSRG
jgi:hypothetical protein